MQARLNPAGHTAEQILDSAEARAQVLGFNGFSYGDVAAELGVSTASLHYHFPSKTDLGVRLIERYTERFFIALAAIEAEDAGASARLRAYADLYESVLAGGKLCLCGMLAAEYETLPAPMRTALATFFARNEAWLARTLTQGRERGEVAFAGEAKTAALRLLGGLEGAMLVARVHGGVEGFRGAAAGLLASFAPR